MDLIQAAEHFVLTLFSDNLSPLYCYHSLQHTKDVVQAVKKITDDEEIQNEYKEKLTIAAWFHDTGFINGHENHETRSIEIASAFLSDHNCSPDYINDVSRFIHVTRFESEPVNELEYIMKDADYSYFGTDRFFMTGDLLRKEWSQTQNRAYNDLDWLNLNLEMLTVKHKYYSSYALQHWQAKKEENIEKTINKIKALTSSTMEKTDTNKKKKDLEDKYDKSVDTMFKITLTNHIKLSDIADSKANILLSVNAIIISIALSTIIPKLDSPGNEHLIIPTFVMVFFSVISIIFAILSTKPNIYSETVTKEDIETKKVNLLFFGNFYRMSYEEYETAMHVLIKDKDYILNTMIKDLYYLGLVLQRKYSLLRTTYYIFLIGIIASVLSFVLAFKGLYFKI